MLNKQFWFQVIFLFLSSVSYFAQQANVWYFGLNAGLDFTTSPPTVLTNGALRTNESCSGISDANGNILFYTNSDTVWNKQHQHMANGIGLFGSNSLAQAALIVKQPGNQNIYYIFTATGATSTVGLRYSIVDISMAAGMGSVTAKNVLLYSSTSDKLNATRHCNGTDVWVLSHDWNSNNFRAYLLTASGINMVPVLSGVGSSYIGATNISNGQMKLSPNGTKLGLASYGLSSFELYDFNNVTGVVSNSLQLNQNTPISGAYGAEFSPDGTKFYGTSYSNQGLYQWNLCAGSNSAIVASGYTVSNTSTLIVQLQVAPDGKIYVINDYQSTLGVINNPNALGFGCNYVNPAVNIAPKTSGEGLPNFMSSYFRSAGYTISANASCQRVYFSSNAFAGLANSACSASGYSVVNAYWNFNDPASGAANTSTLSNPFHFYTSIGTYTPQLIINYNCGADTIKKVVTIAALSPSLTVSGNYTICSGNAPTYTANGASTYSWSNSTTNSTVVLSPTVSSNYILTGTNSASSCTNQINFTIQVLKCLGLQEGETEQSLFIYPNPSKGSVTIENKSAITVVFYTQLGNVVLTKNLEPGKNVLDISALANGLYTLLSQEKEHRQYFKLIKAD